MNTNVANLGGGVIPFSPSDRMFLYKSYMSFVKGGGLYIPTNRRYDISTEVFLLVTLPTENKTRHPVVGKIVWVHRSGSVARPAGIGVQFSDIPENSHIKDEIEKLIAGISLDTPTYTM